MTTKIQSLKNKISLFFTSISMGMMMGTTAFATGTSQPASGGKTTWDTVKVQADSNADAGTLMGNIIGIILTLMRYVGVALLVYGVVEIVMSFMQNQPEAKTKGIIMALCGVVMIALKSVLQAIGVIA